MIGEKMSTEPRRKQEKNDERKLYEAEQPEQERERKEIYQKELKILGGIQNDILSLVENFSTDNYTAGSAIVTDSPMQRMQKNIEGKAKDSPKRVWRKKYLDKIEKFLVEIKIKINSLEPNENYQKMSQEILQSITAIKNDYQNALKKDKNLEKHLFSRNRFFMIVKDLHQQLAGLELAVKEILDTYKSQITGKGLLSDFDRLLKNTRLQKARSSQSEISPPPNYQGLTSAGLASIFVPPSPVALPQIFVPSMSTSSPQPLTSAKTATTTATSYTSMAQVMQKTPSYPKRPGGSQTNKSNIQGGLMFVRPLDVKNPASPLNVNSPTPQYNQSFRRDSLSRA